VTKMISALLLTVAFAGDALRRADEDAQAEDLLAKIRTFTSMEDYHDISSSVIRLQAIVVERDLMHPWAQGLGGMSQFVGSSFVIDNKPGEGPTVITNAHVVENAAVLAAQVPVYGQKTYKARVMMINHDMDIAFVKLDGAEIVQEFEADMAKTKNGVKPVPLYKGPIEVGMEVVAMGFPLGMTTVKVSTGVLSGHEEVSELGAFQHTAPISPGSSGGPAFKRGTNEVVMINFATANAENSEFNNYGIPAFRVQQMINTYNRAQGPEEGQEAPAQGAAMIQTSEKKAQKAHEPGMFNRFSCANDRSQCAVEIPKIHTALTPGHKALYQKVGCETGVYASKILPSSMLANAEPAVNEKTFITEVNGMKVDQFGQAQNDEFFNDPMSFANGLFSKGDLTEKVSLKTCGCGGEITEHSVNVQYNPETEHESIPTVNEPIYSTMDFEQFGPVTFQQLTKNLAQQMIGLGAQQLIGAVVDPMAKPTLIVTDVDQNSEYASQIPVGSLISKINGKDVSTLAELRANFAPTGTIKEESCAIAQESMNAQSESAIFAQVKDKKADEKTKSDGWVLETKEGVEATFPYKQSLTIQKMMIMQGMKPLTEGAKAAILAMEQDEQSAAQGSQEEDESPEKKTEDDSEFAEDPLFQNPLIKGLMQMNSTEGEAGPSLLEMAHWRPIEERKIGRGGAAFPFEIPALF